MPQTNQGPDDNQTSRLSKRRGLEQHNGVEPELFHTAPTTTFLHGDYTIGWICALPPEMTAAKAMLDIIPNPPNDDNTYVLGKIGVHNIVVACMPSGVYGTTSAATVASQ